MQELLKGLPRGGFDRIVAEHQADKYSKGFGCWDQLVMMVYAQLSGAASLRQVEAGFNSQPTHHYHLGTHPVRRSTLAEANAKRNVEVFADSARALMAQATRKLRQQAAQLLYLLDSTSLTLKGRGFDGWTAASRTRHTQGIKLHLLIDAGQALPCWHRFSAANVNDITPAHTLPIEAGARYVFDKGYCDYAWWARLEAQGAHFVTRFKKNAKLALVSPRPIPEGAAAVVLADEVVRLANTHPGGGRRNPYTAPLRRIAIAREDKPTKPLVLATNDLVSDALTIAEQYQARWQIELFFKWIKQHLRIKQFLGRSDNAVRIQILTALIAYLLLALHRQACGFTQSLWQLLGEVRATLFQRPTLEAELYRRRKERQQAFAASQPGLFA